MLYTREKLLVYASRHVLRGVRIVGKFGLVCYGHVGAQIRRQSVHVPFHHPDGVYGIIGRFHLDRPPPLASVQPSGQPEGEERLYNVPGADACVNIA